MQPTLYPPYRQYPPQPVISTEDVKRNEQRIIRKQSNALGFYILTYCATMYALSIGIGMLMNALGVSLNGTAEYLTDIFVSVFAAFIPGLVYMAATGFSPKSAFGKTSVAPALLIPLVFIGMGVSMVANYAASIFANNLSLFGIENHGGSIDTGSMSPLEIVLVVIAVSIVPAFAEEFAFRGLVMGSLKKYGRAFAVVASSVMFSAMHANTTQIVFVIFVGLIFGYVDMLTDSILPSVIIHFINNFYATVLDVLQSNGNLDEAVLTIINILLPVMFCLGGLLSFVYLAKTKPEIFKFSAKEPCEESNANLLSLKSKFNAFFVNPGMMIAMSCFLVLVILNLYPITGSI
ncbi:MAG: CPBP family intramembrane metalloprotease [Ruminococcus sp.]|nr:CPBP family intramembrane metalloprotease [Ruminococcus sp.]